MIISFLCLCQQPQNIYILCLQHHFLKGAREGITTFPHRCGCQRQPRPGLAVPATEHCGTHGRTTEAGRTLAEDRTQTVAFSGTVRGKVSRMSRGNNPGIYHQSP